VQVSGPIAGGVKDAAAAHAAAAARAAGVSVHALSASASIGELQAVSDLFTDTWATPERHPPSPVNSLRALSYSGSYVVAALRDDVMVGAALAFLATAHGRTSLFSHSLAVHPAYRRSGIGYAIKMHQRRWALDRSIDLVQWTFDIARVHNAHLNISKLGALGVRYLPDFYGTMHDDLNAGRHSDRVLVDWHLDGERARAAATTGRCPDARVAVHVAAGDPAGVDSDQDGLPRVHHAPTGDHEVYLVNATALLAEDAANVRRPVWQACLRDVCARAFAAGLVLDDVSRDGWYLFTRGLSCA
jgi:predicted GNAT superfamily acetyltransferase